MLIAVCVVTVFVALAIVSRVRMSRGVSGADSGWMRPEWLAAYRAAHPL